MAGRLPVSTGMNWIIVALLLGIGVALFVLPHHLGDGTGASLSLAHDLGELLTGELGERPSAILMQGLFGLGCLAVFLPALLAAGITVASAGSARTLMIVGGLALVVAGLSTSFIELVSNMTIGFGGGGSKYPETIVAYVAPLFPIVCGVAAIVMGVAR